MKKKNSVLDEPKEILYEMVLEVSGEKFESEGKTSLEALNNLPQPAKMTTKAIFTVVRGAKRFEEIMMPVKAKRLFYPLARKLWAKNLEHLLK